MPIPRRYRRTATPILRSLYRFMRPMTISHHLHRRVNRVRSIHLLNPAMADQKAAIDVLPGPPKVV